MQSDKQTTPPVLLFHGMLSSPQEFALVTNPLKARGIQHQAVSIPGYTLSDEPPALHWQAWRDAAVDTVDTCTPGDQPVILAGLCMGGILAAQAAMERSDRVAGLVLISPTFIYDGWGLSPIRYLRHIGYWTGLDRLFTFSEREPYGVKNPKIRKWVRQELQARKHSAVGPLRMPLRALREGERMMADVRRRLPDLDCPLLIIHAREDEITSFASVQRLYDDLAIADKELVALDNSYHMVTIDNDRMKVVEELERFTKRVSRQHSTRGSHTHPRVASLPQRLRLSLVA